jgi:hypothetical protein
MKFMPQNKKAARMPMRLVGWYLVCREGGSSALLDLGFLEFHMLAYDRVIFVQFQLGGLRARVFLGHVEVTGIRGRDQLDLNDV